MPYILGNWKFWRYFNKAEEYVSELIDPIGIPKVKPKKTKSEEVLTAGDLVVDEQVETEQDESEELIPNKIEPKDEEKRDPEKEDNFNSDGSIRPRMEIVKIPKNEPNAFVCKWTWDVVTNKCALCHNDINSLCIECQADEWFGKKLDEDIESEVRCTTSAGECKHVYHSHCILRWAQRRQICPLCGSTWISLQSSS